MCDRHTINVIDTPVTLWNGHKRITIILPLVKTVGRTTQCSWDKLAVDGEGMVKGWRGDSEGMVRRWRGDGEEMARGMVRGW